MTTQLRSTRLRESNNGSVTDCSVTKKFTEFNLSVTPYPVKRGEIFYLQGVLKI
uniref:Uncharacterized protein n=1 Tax=Amphimedon queenslandica TaxID=400682 RepID=A0A1X7UDP8_AMPQE